MFYGWIIGFQISMVWIIKQWTPQQTNSQVYIFYIESPQFKWSAHVFLSLQNKPPKPQFLKAPNPAGEIPFLFFFFWLFLFLNRTGQKYRPPFPAISYSVYCCRDCCLFFFIVVVMFGFLFYLFILCSWWNLVKGFFDPFLVSLDSWWNLFKGGCLTHLFWVLDGIC